MAQLDEARTKASTITEHTADHNQLHAKANYVFDVRDYGAVGNGVADDTAAITAAIAAMDSGTVIQGELFFPFGMDCLVSTGIVIGDGTKAVNVTVRGGGKWFMSNPPHNGSRLTASDGTIDIFTINGGAGLSGSVVIDGIQLKHGAGATGDCLVFGTSAENMGVIVDRVYCNGGANGIVISSGMVSPIFRDITLRGQTTACLAVDAYMNVPQFDTIYFQSSTGIGISVNAAHLAGGLFSSCVFQAITGSTIKILSGASLSYSHFDNCWWEANSSTMIELAGGVSGLSLSYCTFTNCRFDGSHADVDVIYISEGTPTAAVFGRNLTFAGCYFANLGTGKICNVDTEPTASTDPGFIGATFVNCNGGAYDLFGFHTVTSQPTGIIRIIDSGLTSANVIVNSIYGVKPKYVEERGNAYQVDASKIGFYGADPVAQQTGVAVSAAGIHAALVALGLITA